MRNTAITLTGVLLIVLVGARPALSADRPPNVVFFLVDDLGWTDAGCFGSSFYETPNIDRLASEGVRFTNAYAACHVCSPTRASIMTGKYPARLGLTDWLSGRREHDFEKLRSAPKLQFLPDTEITIAKALKKHGYSTGHFGKWHLGEEPNGPTARGFDVQVPKWNKGWPRAGYHSPFRLNGLADKKGDYLTDRLSEQAVKWIEKNKDKPFFLYLSHFSVHDPIQGRPDLVRKYQKKLARMDRRHGPAFALEGNPDDPNPLSRAQLEQLITQPTHMGYKLLPMRTVKIKQVQDNAQFAGMVEAMDQSLGRVMTKLKQLKLEDNTIVIFFSDNGGMAAANFGNPKRIIRDNQLDKAYSTSNLPLRGAKGWLYEGGIRVPMIVKWPGPDGKSAKKGLVCDEPVISTDFYPSILEMAGLTALPNQHADGKSFVPALLGKPFERGAIYWHFPHYSNHGLQSPGGAVRLGDYKLLDYFENGSVQLFNLKNDPGERKNLAAMQKDKAAELHGMLKAWRKKVNAKLMTTK